MEVEVDAGAPEQGQGLEREARQPVESRGALGDERERHVLAAERAGQLLDREPGLVEDLERINPDLRELVELRYFAGLSMPAIAELRNVSVRTLAREWQRARSMLQVRLSPDGF